MAVGPASPPALTTESASSITSGSATLNGTLIWEGVLLVGGSNYPATVTERGFVVSTSPNPTIADTKIVASGTALGAYTASFTGFAPNTTYYYRAYAMNDAGAGVGYGNDNTVSFYLPAELFTKKYLYKVYTNTGQYLGNLPTPINEFVLVKEINTIGSQISVEIPVSADTSAQQSVTTVDDESGANILDESGSPILSEGAPPIVGLGTVTGTLIRNGNTVVVMEYGYYSANGRVAFRGQIQRWQASFGGDTGSDTITLTVYGDGQDLDQYLVKGFPYTYTLDQSQTAQNASYNNIYYSYDYGGGWNMYGQTFTVGSGVTNVSAISVRLLGTATVTITLYDSPAMNTTLATVTQAVSVGTATEVQFGFPLRALVSPGMNLFFAVRVNQGQSITLYYQNSNVYAGGTAQNSNYGGGSGGGGWTPETTRDLYFKTFSGTGSTSATFTSQNIISGMLLPVLDDYKAAGGLIRYTPTSIGTSWTTLTYTFNTNSVYEAIENIRSMASGGFYYYVDAGTNILNFKQINTTADVVFTKGRHLNQITIGASIEYLENSVFVSGNDVSGVNIYTADQDAASIAQYGIRLGRISDTRAKNVAAARAIGQSAVVDGKDEKYITTISIVDKTYDIFSLQVGMVVGFNGFGTFVDTLLSQIVRVEYHPEYAVLTLGRLPRRTDVALDEITRDLAASLTVDNPASPS